MSGTLVQNEPLSGQVTVMVATEMIVIARIGAATMRATVAIGVADTGAVVVVIARDIHLILVVRIRHYREANEESRATT